MCYHDPILREGIQLQRAHPEDPQATRAGQRQATAREKNACSHEDPVDGAMAAVTEDRRGEASAVGREGAEEEAAGGPGEPHRRHPLVALERPACHESSERRERKTRKEVSSL